MTICKLFDEKLKRIRMHAKMPKWAMDMNYVMQLSYTQPKHLKWS